MIKTATIPSKVAGERVCLHIFLTTGKAESRFLRAARASLKAQLFDRIVLAAKWEPGLKEYEVIEPRVDIFRIRLKSLNWGRSLLTQMLKCMEWYWRIHLLAQKLKPTLIVGHSLSGLPIGCVIAARLNQPVVYDAHELETRVQRLNGPRLWCAELVERHFIQKVDAVQVVSNSIANWYVEAYRIPRPWVVRNMPELFGLPPANDSRLWRDRFSIPDSHLIFIYQGGFFPGRRIEFFLQIFARTKIDRHIVFMGYGELEKLVRDAAENYSNIHFAESVKPMEVLKHTAGADVGLVGVEPVCLSYYYSLPNKLFEYLSAGIPVIYPKFPEMENVIGTSGVGWGADESNEAWMGLINELTSQEIRKAGCHIEALTEQISWENEKNLLLDCFRAAIQNPKSK